MIRPAILARHAVLGLALLHAAAAHAEDTVLRLTEAATIMVAPDELDASLRAEALAATAQDAQRKVNELMRDALAEAKRTEGIEAATGTYNVWRTGPTPMDRTERWQAGQSLNLIGKNAEAMLKLVGDLQQKGLVQGNLGWRLSLAAERKARQEATKQALAALRGRADEAAAVLGMRFDAFREIRLDSVTPPMMPRHLTAQRAVMTSSSAAPPAVESEDVPVTASAEADILLKPR